MKFTVVYPLERSGSAPEFADPEVLAAFARGAEEAGFDAIGFSEHPAPSRKWLESGGHHTFDPLATMAYCAAVTTRLRLMPHLLVLPYHRPLALAKTLTTLDLLSRGRITVVAGTGYLRSEFAALGVDFERRNALFDEGLAALDAAWTADPYRFEGEGFQALEQVQRPAPARPRPPIWLGGNSALTRRRVACVADGWSPLLAPPASAGALRTPGIASLARLVELVTEIRHLREEAGRDPGTLDVQVVAPHPATPHPGGDREKNLDLLGRYAKAGVTSVLVHAPAESPGAALDALAAYGAVFIAQAG